MKKLSFILILLITMASFGQHQNNSTLNKPYIEVTGKSEKEVVPDEIYISITLKERMERGKKVSIQQQESTLKEQLKVIHIPIENLSISNVNATILKTGWFKKDILAIANYTLKVNDASKLKSVYATFQRLKVHQAHIQKVSHSKIIALRKANRIAAMKAAKEKADYLLGAIGEQTGKPMLVNEIASNYDRPRFSNVSTSYGFSKLRSEEVSDLIIDKPVDFEKIKIVSTVYVKFEIK